MSDADKVHFITDPETGKITFSRGDKVATFDMPKVKGGDGSFLGMEDEEVTLEYTRASLLGFRAQRGPSLQPVQLLIGDDVFEVGTKLLSDRDCREIGLLMGARGYSLFPITDIDANDAFFAALFYVGLTRYDDVTQRRFPSMADAETWLREDGLPEVVSHLRVLILSRNEWVKKNLAPQTPTDPGG
jgi:hypothetical protein